MCVIVGVDNNIDSGMVNRWILRIISVICCLEFSQGHQRMRGWMTN